MEDFFSVARINMIKNQLLPLGVRDEALLRAMEETPREDFISPAKLQKLAYIDRPIDIGDRFLQPCSTFALMLQEAKITPRDHVLDLGCCTGYSTAILCHIAKYVVAVEENKKFATEAAENILKMGHNNFSLKHGPLLAGASESGPYDVIILHEIADSPNNNLLAQLKKNGRLVMLHAPKDNQYLKKIALYHSKSNYSIQRDVA